MGISTSLREYYLEIARGHVPGHSVVHKFGRFDATTTTVTAIAFGVGNYQTPLPANATTLRIKAGGNSADTVAGAGARKVMLQGLNETGALVSEEVSLAGASASAVTITTFIRLFRAYVSETGTAAVTALTATQTAAITIENGAGGTDWATIAATNYGGGQTEIGCYTIPLGYTGYLTHMHVNIISNQAADVMFVKRENILTASVPFQANRILFRLNGSIGETTISPNVPIKFNELTDISVLGRSQASTADINVEFTIVLIKNSSSS